MAPLARRFTLIELAVTMFIAMVIITLGMESYKQWNIGDDVNAAASEVGSMAISCRATALANRQYVALIMPGPVVCTGVPDENRYTYARLAFVTNTGSGFDFNRWVDPTGWVQIGRAVSIMEADNDIGINDGTSFCRTPVENNDQVVNKVEMDALGGSGTVNGVRCMIFTPSGRLQYDYPMYITVANATYVGAWIIKQPARLKVTPPGTLYDIGPANQSTVVINRFTGNVSYLYPGQDYVTTPAGSVGTLQ